MPLVRLFIASCLWLLALARPACVVWLLLHGQCPCWNSKCGGAPSTVYPICISSPYHVGLRPRKCHSCCKQEWNVISGFATILLAAPFIVPGWQFVVGLSNLACMLRWVVVSGLLLRASCLRSTLGELAVQLSELASNCSKRR